MKLPSIPTINKYMTSLSMFSTDKYDHVRTEFLIPKHNFVTTNYYEEFHSAILDLQKVLSRSKSYLKNARLTCVADSDYFTVKLDIDYNRDTWEGLVRENYTTN